MESKKFLTIDEVAQEFGIDATILQQFVDSGDVRALADRGTWKYRRDELQGLVDAGKIKAVSLSDGDQVLSFQNPDEDVSYIELDEEALAEHATIINPSDMDQDAPATDEMEATGQSSSDVAIYSGPANSDPEQSAMPSIAEDSDSDVRIASGFEAPRAEDSGILLDFNVDAGATVSSSGSSLRLPQTVPGAVEGNLESDTEAPAWDEAAESIDVGGSGVLASEHSGTSDSSVRLAGVAAEESGILLDDSALLTGGASGIVADSGITLDSGDDSGITLDAGHDSGISLDTAKPDSGISLAAGDSGISLGGADSGISLDDSGADSGISIGNARTIADMKINRDIDKTQTLDISNESDDSSFDINLDDPDTTSELLLGSDDDLDEVSPTVVRKGRPAPGSLSEAFELDDGAEVEDLEISQDLDADADEELEELSDDEEVFEASDETFSGDEVEATADEDEDYLEAAETKSKKPAGPREPAWGMGMTIGLVVCTVFLVVNTLLLWSGVSTMWNGAEDTGPGGALLQSIAGLI